MQRITDIQRSPATVLSILATMVALSLTACKPGAAVEEQKVVTEVPVSVGKVTRTTLQTRIEAYGLVEPEPAGGGLPAGSSRLSAPASGVVMSVPAKEGAHVEAGTVIVQLDDRLARSTLALAEQQFERQNKLRAVEGTSEKSVQEAAQQLAAARTQLALLQLATPLAGIVARINVQPGQTIDMNTVAAEVVALDRLVATVNVPAAEAALLRTGQPAEIFLGSAEQSTAAGRVSFVSPQIDPKTGTALVRLAFSNGGTLIPGQLVRARIVSGEHARRLAVPFESIVTDADGQSVVAILEGDKAIQKPVKVGVRDGGLVEIEGEGLKEGDTVVTIGAYGLPKETKVKIATP